MSVRGRISIHSFFLSTINLLSCGAVGMADDDGCAKIRRRLMHTRKLTCVTQTMNDGNIVFFLCDATRVAVHYNSNYPTTNNTKTVTKSFLRLDLRAWVGKMHLQTQEIFSSSSSFREHHSTCMYSSNQTRISFSFPNSRSWSGWIIINHFEKGIREVV